MRNTNLLKKIFLYFPSIFMIAILLISFFVKGEFFKYLTSISLVIYFPMFFLFQGIISANIKSQFFYGLLNSSICFLIVSFIRFNVSIISNLIFYIMLYVLGFVLCNIFFIRNKKNDNNKKL